MHTFTRKLLCVGLFLLLSACATAWGPGLPITNGNYAPDVALKPEARRQYDEDVAICQKQIMAHYGDKYLTNNAIIDLRRCLIEKGYVLLS
jgi:hypothetical protein